jgi:GTP cyclohydrolase IA
MGPSPHGLCLTEPAGLAEPADLTEPAGLTEPDQPDNSAAQLPRMGANPSLDRAAAERAVRALLIALGQDPELEHLRQTPRRVANAYAELLSPQPFQLTTFANDEGYDQLVLARDIAFQSLCEHHLLPFHGVAHIGYLPGERIVGLSKLARVLERFARRLQVQERLTKQVADCLDSQLRPVGVGVVIEAEHQCMSLRGVRAHGSRTLTSALHGHLRRDAAARQEFFALVHRT